VRRFEGGTGSLPAIASGEGWVTLVVWKTPDMGKMPMLPQTTDNLQIYQEKGRLFSVRSRGGCVS